MSYQIKIPSCIFGGAGSIENVKAVIEKENAKKVIIFTDKGIRSTGLLDLLTDILEENGKCAGITVKTKSGEESSMNHHIRMLKRL